MRKSFKGRNKRQSPSKTRRSSWGATSYNQSRLNTKKRRSRSQSSYSATNNSPSKLGSFPSIYILGTMVVLLTIYLLTRQVGTVVVGFDTSLDKQIEEATQEYFDTHSRYAWLINESRLEGSLGQEFSSLKNIEASTSILSGTLTITATKRAPNLIWQTGGIQYLLDEDGIVMGTVNKSAKLPLVIDTINVPVAPGNQVATSEFVEFVSDTDARMKKSKLPVKNYLVSTSSRELQMNLKDPELVVKLSTNRPVAIQAKDLLEILKQRRAGKLKINSYIDLRSSRKAYYK